MEQGDKLDTETWFWLQSWRLIFYLIFTNALICDAFGYSSTTFPLLSFASHFLQIFSSIKFLVEIYSRFIISVLTFILHFTVLYYYKTLISHAAINNFIHHKTHQVMNTHALYLACRSLPLSIIFLIFLTLSKGHFNDQGVCKSHSISSTHNIFWSLLSKTAISLSLSPTNSLVSSLTLPAKGCKRVLGGPQSYSALSGPPLGLASYVKGRISVLLFLSCSFAIWVWCLKS